LFPPPDETARVAAAAEQKEKAAYSFVTSAQKFLEPDGDKRTARREDITEKAAGAVWLMTASKTPAASVYAQVVTEIKRKKTPGEVPSLSSAAAAIPVSANGWLRGCLLR
jgi:restriction system protein